MDTIIWLLGDRDIKKKFLEFYAWKYYNFLKIMNIEYSFLCLKRLKMNLNKEKQFFLSKNISLNFYKKLND